MSENSLGTWQSDKVIKWNLGEDVQCKHNILNIERLFARFSSISMSCRKLRRYAAMCVATPGLPMQKLAATLIGTESHLYHFYCAMKPHTQTYFSASLTSRKRLRSMWVIQKNREPHTNYSDILSGFFDQYLFSLWSTFMQMFNGFNRLPELQFDAIPGTSQMR